MKLVRFNRSGSDHVNGFEVSANFDARFIQRTNYRCDALIIDGGVAYLACSLVEDALGRGWGRGGAKEERKFGRRWYRVVNDSLVSMFLDPFERCHPSEAQLERNEQVKAFGLALIELLPSEQVTPTLAADAAAVTINQL